MWAVRYRGVCPRYMGSPHDCAFISIRPAQKKDAFYL